MAFRTVLLSGDVRVHVRNGQLVINTDDTVTVPLEDIAVVVIENPRILLSTATMARLCEHGVATAVCDSKHLPAGILLPHSRHSRQLAITRAQVNATVPLKKRLWQQLVRAKLNNQAACLDLLERPGGDELREYARSVQSGDATSRESVGAGYYFPRLMPGVRRHGGGDTDAALDYGYAVLRAAVARSLVGHGMYPAFGIHHESQLNQFNLADDLLEPFRPFVDYRVISQSLNTSTVEMRAALVGTLLEPCLIDEKGYTVSTAITSCAQSLSRALSEGEYRHLVWPSVSNDRQVEYSIMD